MLSWLFDGNAVSVLEQGVNRKRYRPITIICIIIYKTLRLIIFQTYLIKVLKLKYLYARFTANVVSSNITYKLNQDGVIPVSSRWRQFCWKWGDGFHPLGLILTHTRPNHTYIPVTVSSDLLIKEVCQAAMDCLLDFI